MKCEAELKMSAAAIARRRENKAEWERMKANRDTSMWAD
jgi:hypothetical protein